MRVKNQGEPFSLSHYRFFQTCYQLLLFTAHLTEVVSLLAYVLQKIHLQDTNHEPSRGLPHKYKGKLEQTQVTGSLEMDQANHSDPASL